MNIILRFFLVLLILGNTSAAFTQTVIKEVVRFENVNENLLLPDRFRPYGQGYEKQDAVFLCNNGDDAAVHRGVMHSVVLDQTLPLPIYAEARSKAENVGGTLSADYSIYLDLIYDDGTPLWGQSVSFSTGTHDWERKQIFIIPEKPIKSLTFYTLFRNKTGKALFRDLKLSVQKVGDEAALFDGVPIRIPKAGQKSSNGISLQIRNAADDSNFVLLNENPFGIRSKIESDGSATQVTLASETADDRCLTLVFSRSLDDLENIQFCEMRKNVPASEYRLREYLTPVSTYGMNHIGTSGRLSKHPFAAVVGRKADQETGYAVGIDPAYPAFFRTGYNEATQELFVAVDLALTKESPKAELRFVKFDFAAKYGFRGALDGYQRLFPDFFRNRIPNQGLWMPFAKISKIPKFEDFGFAVKEGNDETTWDDEHGILTFRYTEPMTWWLTLPKETPRTYEAAIEYAQKLADGGNATAKALFVAGIRDADGRFGHIFLDTPWCDGIVWSFNDLPGIPNGGFALKWNDEIVQKLYGEEAAKKAVLDGEYVDSAEGYVTAVLDFDRNHFSAARRPLVFSRNDHRPAIFRGLIAYEYVRTLSEALHARGKYVMANGAPDALCWLIPYLDVSGTETNWNGNGKWNPMPMNELLYRRAFCGQKPYCFLMNTDFTKWSYELTEKYMKRSLAFGMFPGFFSADASTKHYFTQPELYDRDRPLFKKYVPLCKEAAEAGWQPIRKVTSSNEKVFIERFGDEKPLLTVFNDSSESQSVIIRFEADLPQRWIDRISGVKFETKANELTLTIAPEDIIVLKSE